MMPMKTYLTDTFNYNDATNKKLLDKIKLLPNKEEAIRFFSHLINCQYKWMARIVHDPNAPAMSWWDPVYHIDDLEKEWNKSLMPWINYINERSDEVLATEVSFVGFDGSLWAASPMDIALQLNYHPYITGHKYKH
jgi:uncharacterized damage-inducible protein DinB